MNGEMVIQMIRAAVCGSKDGAFVSRRMSTEQDLKEQEAYESGKFRAFEEVLEIIDRVSKSPAVR